MVNTSFDPNTNPEEQHDIPKDSKSVFVWLDILGFSNDVKGAQDNETKYAELESNLTDFQKIFNKNSNNIKSTIISDGILLELKLYSSNMVKDVFDFIVAIREAQLKFCIDTKKLIRGGIAVANSVKEDTENGVFLTYGLSAAVKMEKKVCWPIIGMDEGVLDELAGIVSMNSDEEKVLKNIKEKFKKTYNSNGELIYFIDFLGCQLNEQLRVKALIKNKFGTSDNKVVLKYSWLYRYYMSANQSNEHFLNEVQTGSLIL